MSRQQKSVNSAWITLLFLLAGVVGLVLLNNRHQQQTSAWLDATYQTALDYETNGELLAAWYGYQMILDYQPDHPDALQHREAIKNTYDTAISNDLPASANLNLPTPAYTLPPTRSYFIPILLNCLAILLAGITIYFLSTTIVKKARKPAPPDVLEVMIGSSHSQDLLGEMYEVSYLANQAAVAFEPVQLIGVIEETIRRITKAYQLSPVGYPGQGPIPYSPAHHVTLEHLAPDQPVYIVNIGWYKEEKAFLLPLVSPTPPEITEVSHG